MPSAEELDQECASMAERSKIMKEAIDDRHKPFPSRTDQYSLSDFKLIKVVGYGNMGTVFLSVHRSTGEPFAMKVMHKDVLRAKKSSDRLEKESRILAMLDHPFLPRLIAHLESDHHVFLVTEFCSGGDLNKLRQKQLEKSFSETAIRFYAAEVVSALEHLHRRGIIYRDLKPENILIGEDGHITLTDFDLSRILPLKDKKKEQPQKKEILQLNVADQKPPIVSSPMQVQLRCKTSLFGRRINADFLPTPCGAKVFPQEAVRSSRAKPKEAPRSDDPAKMTKRDTSDVMRSHSFVGTEEYVAPELLLGSGHGRAVDWWTLGILLYELLYDHTPFRGTNKRETFSNIISKEPEMAGPPSDLKDLISKLLIKEPERRLGATLGAKEVKRHSFFKGVKWLLLKDISRPPVLPAAFSLEDLQNKHREDINIDEQLTKYATTSFRETLLVSKRDDSHSIDK